MAGRRNTSADDVLIISDDSSPSFVDLTQESPGDTSSTSMEQSSQATHFFSSSANEIVDLTYGDNSPVILDPVIQPDSRRRSQRLQRTRRSARRHSPYSSNSDITIDSDEENVVQVLSPVDVNNTLPWLEIPGDVSTPSDTGNTPCRKQVKCPVCMDNETQIRTNGLQLNSTVCGHIFCNRCIRAAIQSQHRCPTCRHKLTIRQVHPIFL